MGVQLVWKENSTSDRFPQSYVATTVVLDKKYCSGRALSTDVGVYVLLQAYKAIKTRRDGNVDDHAMTASEHDNTLLSRFLVRVCNLLPAWRTSTSRLYRLIRL